MENNTVAANEINGFGYWELGDTDLRARHGWRKCQERVDRDLV